MAGNAFIPGMDTPSAPGAAPAISDADANAILAKIIGNAGQQPNFQSIVDPATGQLQSKYTLQAAPDIGFQGNDALNYMKNYATATGPSAWGQLMQQQVAQQKAAGMDAAGAQANSAAGAARSDLAAHGGASAGARERLATKGMLNSTMAKQQVGRDANTNSLAASLQDETNKNAMLNSWGSLNSADLGRQQDLSLANRSYDTGVQQTNLNNLIGDNTNAQQFNMAKWQTGMQALGNYETSQAQQKAGKK